MEWFKDTSSSMPRCGILFLQGLSLPEFQRLYGAKEQCEAALEKARWPDGSPCLRCHAHEQWRVNGCRLKRYQCRYCGHHATLTAGTDHAGHPIASDHLVFGLRSDRPGQNRDLLVGAQSSPGRELRHGLAGAQQDSAGDG